MKIPKAIFNTPLLIQPEALDTVMQFINSKTHLQIEESKTAANLQANAGQVSQSQLGVAIIPVQGILTYRQSDDLFAWLFGGTTYEDIRAGFRAALADPAVKVIVFDIDSPGGEAAGAFDLVDEIYHARGTKPIYAIANETAYSAAYAIASAADMIYTPRTGSVGSVGVIAIHMDQSKWDENVGVKYTPIFAGTRKNDFTPHEPLSAEAKAAGQATVDDTYDIFVKTVARNRDITPADVRKTEAAIYQGKKAVDAGMADTVMPWDKAMADILKKNKIKGGGIMTLMERIKALFASAPAEEIKPGLAEAGYISKEESDKLIQEAKTVSETTIEEAKAATRKEVLAWVAGIFDICSVAGMEKMATGLITEGITLEQARERIVNAKALEAEKTQIRSTVGAVSTGAVNPLIEDAKKRAEAANIRVVKK
jgi:signal peptide peptidase SppA